MRMTAIVFTIKKQMELLRKNGKVYTIRLNNKKEGRVTVYFGRNKVAKGNLRKVSDNIHSEVLEKYVDMSGFEDVEEWMRHIDEVFLFKGLTGESYKELALYEVCITEWLEGKLEKYIELAEQV